MCAVFVSEFSYKYLRQWCAHFELWPKIVANAGKKEQKNHKRGERHLQSANELTAFINTNTLTYFAFEAIK